MSLNDKGERTDIFATLYRHTAKPDSSGYRARYYKYVVQDDKSGDVKETSGEFPTKTAMRDALEQKYGKIKTIFHETIDDVTTIIDVDYHE